jgi:hypothetical protein
MLTRRGFVLGVGALVVAGGALGAAEAVEHPGERQRLLHRIGLASSPDEEYAASGAHQVSGHLASRYTGSSMGWTVSRPGFHDAAYWRSAAPDQLRVVGPALGIAVS